MITIAAPAAGGAPSSGEVDQTLLFRFRDERLTEASGLAVHAETSTYFTVEDAGNANIVWALGSDGRVRGRYFLEGASNADWEDISIGPGDGADQSLYVADTGDAYFTRPRGSGPRRSFAVYRAPLPVLSHETSGGDLVTDDVVRWRLTYPDSKGHNAEAMLVSPVTGRIWLVDKPGNPTENATLWALPSSPIRDGLNMLRRVATLPVTRVTGAAFAPNGRRVVVRNDQFAYTWRVEEDNFAAAFDEAPEIVPLPRQPQGEGIAFASGGHSFVTSSEGRDAAVVAVGLHTRPQSAAASKRALPSSSGQEAREWPSPWALGAAAAALALATVLVSALRKTNRPVTSVHRTRSLRNVR